MSEEKTFQEAVQAIQDGKKDRARDILTRLLKTDQKNPDFWLYMSAVVDSPSEKVFCLESALRLDPENQAARRGLILLGSRAPDESIVPVPVVKKKWSTIPKMIFLRTPGACCATCCQGSDIPGCGSDPGWIDLVGTQHLQTAKQN
jgi:hypothetical protein